MKYGKLTLGQIEAIINRLGGEDAALNFLNDDFMAPKPNRSWSEKSGVIYFSVTSDGTTGEGWIKRQESKGFHIGYYAKQMLSSPEFKSTNGVTTEVAVLKGTLFSASNRTTQKIYVEAEKRKLSKPNVEVACLIREQFTDEEMKVMGLWDIVTMHEPVRSFTGDLGLLVSDANRGGRRIDSTLARTDFHHQLHRGFAFAVSETQA